MGYCLPINETKKLLAAIGDGSFDIDSYADQPDTAARRAYVAKFVGDENAKEVNTLMEQKMLLADWQRGMVNAVKKMANLSDQTKADYVKRINNMDRLLSPEDEKQFYADITEQRLKVAVTADEARHIAALAKRAQELRGEKTDSPAGVSDEYLRASAELHATVASLQPVSAVRQIFHDLITTGRNFMLMNPATPLKTMAGQVENSLIDMVTRRVASMAAKGMVGGVAKEIGDEAWKTFRNTGFNTLSMSSVDDAGKLGEGHNFDIPSGEKTGGAVLRAIEAGTGLASKWTSKVAIDWEHNYAFTKFYQKAWADAANMAASRLAEKEGGDAGRAEEVIRDAARIQPLTEAGKMVRDAARYNAARVTGTADTVLSKASMKVVDEINRRVPGLGNFLFSIVKIPTNLAAYGAENAGMGLITGPLDMIEGRKLMDSGNLANRYKGTAQFAKGFQTLARTVGVLTASYMIASQMDKNDFKTDSYGASFVKLGGTWVNMEYFYALDPALAGFMDMKKQNGKTAADEAQQYVVGATGPLRNIPIVSGINDIFTDLANPSYQKGIGKYFTSLAGERFQPAFFQQLEKGHGIEGIFFGTTGLPTQQEMAKLGAK